MKYCVMDIEANGFLKVVNTFHCMCYKTYDKSTNTVEEEVAYILNVNDAVDFLNSQECIVAHNIICYDIPVLEKLSGKRVTTPVIDTLALSWYLYLDRTSGHGLASWGEEFGIPKPKIDDWENLSIEEYVHRCTEDVEINMKLFLKQFKYLEKIYGEGNTGSIIRYLNFKMECLRDQAKIGIDLDLPGALALKEELEGVIGEKLDMLKQVMPKQVFKEKPSKTHKKDGSISVQGSKWYALLDELGLPHSTPIIYQDGNPKSHKQLKDWLFMLGWEPDVYTVSKATGKKIPQVTKERSPGLTQSVKDLYEVEPDLESLDGLYLVSHRLGIVKSFLDSEEDGKVIASARGFTNTLRLKHAKPIVNLPGIYRKYGKEIRSLLVAPQGDYMMCGSDISGLEDTTKQHFIYFFDPEYVNNMRVPGFDPHLDIGVFAGLITEEQSNRYKILKKKSETEEGLTEQEYAEYSPLNKKRGEAKTVNFAAVYGAGPPKIASTLKCSLVYAKKLHRAYWQRNKAVKKVANATTVKVVDGQKWLFNPISKYWYFLKEDKDRFSTLNQGSGAFVFDVWLMKVKEKGIQIVLQYHDEILTILHKDDREEVSKALYQSMEEVNEIIKLNVPVTISVDFGQNYAECH